MVQGHDRFHDARNACGRFEVANLRFDRANGNIASSLNASPQPGKCGEFRRVADLCGRPVGFHQFNGRSRIARLTVGSGNGLNLAALAWCGNAFSSAV